MKAAVILCVALVVALGIATPLEKYSARYDNINVEEILENERLLNNYIKCMKDNSEAGCTPEGKALKAVLAEALATDCDKCTDAQKGMMTKIIPFLRKNRPEDWKQLQTKYDPEGVWAKGHPNI